MRKFASLWVCVFAASAMAPAQTVQPRPAELRIVTQPEGAMVSLDDAMVGAAPVTVPDTKPGRHLVVVRKEGFREARRTITTTRGQKTGVEIRMEPLNALLLVHSEPSGAEIQINGGDRGRTPLMVTDLPVGRHRLRASTPGYAPKELDLVAEDRTPQKIEIVLTSSSAILALSSEPPGAAAVVNGISRGVTPCVVDRIPSGDAIVEMQLDGHEPFRQSVRLGAGQREAITARLVPVPASLTVVSIPAGARIYVENQFRGESPLTIEKLEPGSYRLRAEMPGYAAVARTVQLDRARKLVEEFRMARNCGVLEITTEPAGVSVFVDGESKGTTSAKPEASDNISESLRIDLVPIGPHRIQFTKPGFFDENLTVEIEKDKTVSSHQKLRRRFIPNVEVRTSTEVVRGVLIEVDPQGNVKIEVRPGITRTIPASDVRSRQPLRVDVK